ncbi:MAG: N-acetyl-gamma-glutamyl-phosphate reductase [Candidatus Eutrophobiaceae bacterium]
MLDAGIIGAVGYTGMELVRLLHGHPGVHLRAISSSRHSGQAAADAVQAWRGRIGLNFVAHDDPIFTNCDVVFIAAPDKVSMQHTPKLLEQGVRVVDLSADFRLADADLWEKWYGCAHTHPHLLDVAVYGLPELYRDQLATARLIANPGCYPTAICLALLPLLEQADLIDVSDIIADAKSGASGAGRTAARELLLCEVDQGFRPYAASGHRHLPEIRQVLAKIAGKPVNLSFVPHLLPMIRGIEASIYVKSHSTPEALRESLERRYRNEPFVDVLPMGEHPDTRSVSGSNLCRIAVHKEADSPRIVILSVIDNLIKGAAGQAVQNMNIACGLPETLGLESLSVLP